MKNLINFLNFKKTILFSLVTFIILGQFIGLAANNNIKNFNPQNNKISILNNNKEIVSSATINQYIKTVNSQVSTPYYKNKNTIIFAAIIGAAALFIATKLTLGFFAKIKKDKQDKDKIKQEEKEKQDKKNREREDKDKQEEIKDKRTLDQERRERAERKVLEEKEKLKKEQKELENKRELEYKAKKEKEKAREKKENTKKEKAIETREKREREKKELIESMEKRKALVGKEKIENYFPEITTCKVCKEEYGNEKDLIKLPCGHIFHLNCISNWFLYTNEQTKKQNHKCPLCIKKANAEESIISILKHKKDDQEFIQNLIFLSVIKGFNKLLENIFKQPKNFNLVNSKRGDLEWTPLHFAAKKIDLLNKKNTGKITENKKRKAIEIIKLLSLNGAKLEQKDKNNQRAADLISDKSSQAFIELNTQAKYDAISRAIN